VQLVKSALAGVLALPTLAAVPANAAEPGRPLPDGALASYNGRKIDLSEGWQGAQACVVFDEGDVQCFDSRREMYTVRDAYIEQHEGTATLSGTLADPVSALGDCGGSGKGVALFSATNYGGTELDFVTTNNTWSNLSAYGFDNTMESWVNTKSCTQLLAENANGGGAWLGLAPQGKSANAGAWNNRASSAYVAY
jgi:hypothetical protein